MGYIDEHVRLQKRPFSKAGRAALIGLVPILFLSLFVFLPGLWVARRFAWSMGLGRGAALSAGIALLAAGGALYLWTIGLFAKAWGTQVPLAPTQRLVTTGPYGVTRNPMVTGAMLMGCGLAFLLSSWSVLVGCFIGPGLYLVYIRRVEERELLARFGEDYARYKESTPFVVPRIWRRR